MDRVNLKIISTVCRKVTSFYSLYHISILIKQLLETMTHWGEYRYYTTSSELDTQQEFYSVSSLFSVIV